jgi:hypothetical protein
MSRTTLFILTAALLSTPLLRAEHPDFAGTWTLDAASSTFAGGPQVTNATLTIDKRHKWIHMAESFTFTNGNKQKEFDWKIDDKFHPINGPGYGEVLARWDHDVLIGDRRTGEGASIETVSLSARQPGELVETIHRAGGESTLVWKRTDVASGAR